MSIQPQALAVRTAEIEQFEGRLRRAMLAGDVDALNDLIAERLVFVGIGGSVISKEDDLSLYRFGEQRIIRLDVEESRIEVVDSVAIVVVLAHMVGTFHGQPFRGRFRQMRTWALIATRWQIIAGSVCVAAT